ncbi:sporadic carbohydrate cluster protein, LIC12192 family [Candidatus Thioglobus sp.]|nr:sporadic carbohydrate cluster protein, LIC12192 family [Candidatus Thioglobus sp.]
MKSEVEKRFRGYIFSRPFMEERVPQHVQNIIIRDYCSKKGIQYLLSATEYAMENSALTLRQLVKDLSSIDGIVAYSVFQMPEDDIDRHSIFNKVLLLKKEIHFAVEGLSIYDNDSYNHIENIWKVKKTLPHCESLEIL